MLNKYNSKIKSQCFMCKASVSLIKRTGFMWGEIINLIENLMWWFPKISDYRFWGLIYLGIIET